RMTPIIRRSFAQGGGRVSICGKLASNARVFHRSRPVPLPVDKTVTIRPGPLRSMKERCRWQSSTVSPGPRPLRRTRLREVLFAEDPAGLGTRPLVEGEAYRLLLEILCGLQSPMVGETQVMG